jgi:hypothetical protein
MIREEAFSAEDKQKNFENLGGLPANFYAPALNP